MQISLRLHMYTSKTYSDNTHPVLLQYIIEGKVKKKVLTRCKREDWDFKTNRVKNKVVNSARINRFLSDEFAKAEADLYDLKSGIKSISEIFKEKSKFSLEQAFQSELERLAKEFKSGYYDKILAIKKQIKDTSIDVAHIDEKWFGKMINHLTELGNSQNTIKKKIKLMRGIILRYSAKGVTKEIKAVTIATTKPVKQKLTSAEVGAIQALELPDEMINVVRDIFLMQVYTRGARVGDILQAYSKNFENGRFIYVDDKTGKEMNVKLIPAAQSIVDKYFDKYERLFPLFTWTPNKKLTPFENERERLKRKEICTTVVNKHLKVIAAMAGIKKPVSSHIARHTFARMAIDKINNPMVTMELLGHSSLAVHQNYLNDIRKDDMLDAATDDIFS